MKFARAVVVVVGLMMLSSCALAQTDACAGFDELCVNDLDTSSACCCSYEQTGTGLTISVCAADAATCTDFAEIALGVNPQCVMQSPASTLTVGVTTIALSVLATVWQKL